MAYCADTNILLRWVQPETAASAQARAAVKALHDRGEIVYITPQNLVEFWSVATRPVASNGLGMTSEQADTEAKELEAFFPLLPDTSTIHPEWRRLVVATRTSGATSHDARIAAALKVHGIGNILTFNVDDFKRFDHIKAVSPADVPTDAK